MTLRPSFLLLGILPLGATFLASGCGSGDCENTGSCGDYSDSGEGGNAGRGGSAGSSAAGTRG
ncbi:MAG TPA: hypothetical protein VGK41_09640, partial [Solirubrobacterales bacterium]